MEGGRDEMISLVEMESEGTSRVETSCCEASGRTDGYIRRRECERRRSENGCCPFEVQLRREASEKSRWWNW